MELTSISTVACIVPTNDKEIAYTSSSFIFPHISYAPQGNDYQISAKDEKETLTWNVNQVATNDNIPEQENLVNYAINGFDVASLSISVCNGPIQDMYQARKQNLNAFFRILETKLAYKKDVQTEFAYICFHDEGCYDLRKEKDRSNEIMLEKGMEGIMKRGNLKDIWDDALRGTAWPSILVIKLIDVSKNTVGRLALFDLLHPRFSPLLRSGEDKSYHYSFKKFINAVNTLTTEGGVGKLSMNNCVLMNELGKYIIGRNKLTVFGYMNDKMVTEIHWRETKSLLDLMQALKDIPVHMLPNPSAKEVTDNKHLKYHISAMVKQNKLLKSNIQNEKKTNTLLKDTIQQRQNNLQSLSDARNAEMEYLKFTIQTLNFDYTTTLEQLESTIESLKDKNKEIMQLKSENVDISDQVKDLRFKLIESTNKLNQVDNDLIVSKKQLHTLANENLAIDNINKYLKTELNEKREERFKLTKLYEKETESLQSKLNDEISERKKIETKFQSVIEKDNKFLTDYQDKLENMKKEYEQKEKFLIEKYELKKKKIQEKAQARVASFEPIMREKDEKINQLLERLKDYSDKHENNTDDED